MHSKRLSRSLVLPVLLSLDAIRDSFYYALFTCFRREPTKLSVPLLHFRAAYLASYHDKPYLTRLVSGPIHSYDLSLHGEYPAT